VDKAIVPTGKRLIPPASSRKKALDAAILTGKKTACLFMKMERLFFGNCFIDKKSIWEKHTKFFFKLYFFIRVSAGVNKQYLQVHQFIPRHSLEEWADW